LLARFQPRTANGSGTPTTPHVGVRAAARAARVGETITLLPGLYETVQLRNVSGTRTRPLVISAAGFALPQHPDAPADAERNARAVIAGPVVAVTDASSGPLDAPPALRLENCAHVRVPRSAATSCSSTAT